MRAVRFYQKAFLGKTRYQFRRERFISNEVPCLLRPSVMHYVELGSSAVTETVGSVKSKSAIEVQPCQCKSIDNKKGIRVKWYMPAAAQLKHSSVEE